MYEQIKAQISDAILGGEVGVGEMLPSLRQLAAQLRVSIITVTRAYNELVALDLVANEHGRGFVVCAIPAATAAGIVAERIDDAVRDVVDAGRAARLDLAALVGKVEAEWKTRK
jgi:GntR family transcriptional regulator